jgi:hypothetical protein
LIHHEYHIDWPGIESGPQRKILGLKRLSHGTAYGAYVCDKDRGREREQAKSGQGCSQRHCIVATAAGESEEFLVLMVSCFCPLVLIVKLNLMFVDPCLVVQFMKKNPTRCKTISKWYYSKFI